MEDALAQAIILVEDDEVSYSDVIEAVAEASVKCEVSEVKYREWAALGQRKTVRRADEKLYDKLVRTVTEAGLSYYIIEHPIKVIAIEPILYSEFLKPMKRAQVSGFRTSFGGEPIIEDVSLISEGSFIVDSSLEMPVGKAAVQYAHAQHYFREKFGYVVESPELVFATREVFLKCKDRASFIVTDSGLTVFGEPTDTVCYV